MTREEKNERHREYMKGYRSSAKGQKLRDYQREYQKQYRAVHNEEKRERERELYRQNPMPRRAQLSRRRAVTRQWLASIKMASGCVDCGFKTHSDALHFDHLPQYEKKFHIGRQMGLYGREAIIAEIAKCEVRCANCHAIKTALRRLNG